jgi:uncharacterized protein YbjT (DUF2867 family)
MILVTGSTGTFGRHVAKELQKQNIAFKAAGQGSDKIKSLLGDDVNFSEFDWADSSTFNNLLRGITQVYLVSPPNSSTFSEQVVPFLQEAKKQGVTYIVLSSVLGSDANKESPLYKAEVAVQHSGIDYTIVRPNFILHNFINHDLGSIQNGVIYLPSGEGKTSYIDMRDVASFIVEVLKNPAKHTSKTYTLTGSEALTHQEIAGIFTKVLGVEIKNINPTEDEYKNMLTGYNVPQSIVDFMAALYSFIKAGYFENVTDDFRSVTGRAPVTFEQFVSDHKAIFSNS